MLSSILPLLSSGFSAIESLSSIIDNFDDFLALLTGIEATPFSS